MLRGVITNLYERISNFSRAVADFSRAIAVASVAPTDRQASAVLFSLGCILLVFGLSSVGLAAGEVDYEGQILPQTVNHIFEYGEGSFGVLVMVCAGCLSIGAASMGNYRTSLALLVIPVGFFITRSIVGTFFNDDNIKG